MDDNVKSDLKFFDTLRAPPKDYKAAWQALSLVAFESSDEKLRALVGRIEETYHLDDFHELFSIKPPPEKPTSKQNKEKEDS